MGDHYRCGYSADILRNEDDADRQVWKYPNEKITDQKMLLVASGEEALFVRKGQIVRFFRQGKYELSQDLNAVLFRSEQGQDVFLPDGLYFVREHFQLPARFRVRPQIYFHIHGEMLCDTICVSGEYCLQVEWPHEMSARMLWALWNICSGEREEWYWPSRFNDHIESALWGIRLEFDPARMYQYSLIEQMSAKIHNVLNDTLQGSGVSLAGLKIQYADFYEILQKAEVSYQYMMSKPASPPVSDEDSEPSVGVQERTESTSSADKHEALCPAPSAAKKEKVSGMAALGKAIGMSLSGFGGFIGMGLGGIGYGITDLLRDMVRSKPKGASAKKDVEVPPTCEPVRSPAIQKIHISAVAPKKFLKADYTMVHVVLYEKQYRHIVNALKRAEDQEEQATAEVPEKARIRVCLSSPDVEIPDNDQESQWYGEYLKFSFGVRMPGDFAGKSIYFHAKIYINGVIASNLSFKADCVSRFEQKLTVERRDVMLAFASYASEDRDEVIRVIQGMRKARTDLKVFMDVESLRSGDNWQERLYGEIDGSDVLFLCWSRAAKASEWVDKEWRYALTQKGRECIDPVPLEPAEICPPPAELDQKHFNDALNYMRKNRNW